MEEIISYIESFTLELCYLDEIMNLAEDKLADLKQTALENHIENTGETEDKKLYYSVGILFGADDKVFDNESDALAEFLRIAKEKRGMIGVSIKVNLPQQKMRFQNKNLVVFNIPIEYKEAKRLMDDIFLDKEELNFSELTDSTRFYSEEFKKDLTVSEIFKLKLNMTTEETKELIKLVSQFY